MKQYFYTGHYMSSIQLSEELIIDVQKTLVKHDEKALEMGVAVQYLSAITGLLLANFKNHNLEQKRELLHQLFDFTDNVMTDNINQQEQAAEPAQPVNNDAFGIWKPE